MQCLLKESMCPKFSLSKFVVLGEHNLNNDDELLHNQNEMHLFFCKFRMDCMRQPICLWDYLYIRGNPCCGEMDLAVMENIIQLSL